MAMSVIAANAPVRAQEICADPANYCGSSLQPACLSRLGAGSIQVQPGDVCEVQFERYLGCLQEVAAQCGQEAPVVRDPTPTRAACDDAMAQSLWAEVRDSDGPLELESFAETCPNSPFANIARARANDLRARPLAAAAAPQAAPVVKQLTFADLPGVWKDERGGWSVRMEIQPDGSFTSEMAGGRRRYRFRGVINDSLSVRNTNRQGWSGLVKLRGTFPEIQARYDGPSGSTFDSPVFTLTKEP